MGLLHGHQDGHRHIFREVGVDRADEFLRRGYRGRHFFPHRIHVLPKCGPDGFKLATRMCGDSDPNHMWELVLYASEPVVDEFPPELFFDDDLIWHQQHFGKPGQVATANLVVNGSVVHSMVHVSDLVQRIGRRRDYKSRVENRFKGWPHMLLNAVLGVAAERGARWLRTPTAGLAMQHTDPARTVGPDLFERVYDRTVQDLVPAAQRDDGWWLIDVGQAGDRVVMPSRRQEALAGGRTVCLCHDIEAGFGHPASPYFASYAHRASPRALERMLEIEAQAGCRATYHVLGALFDHVRDQIQAGGHCLAFHSYEHRVGEDGREVGELDRCRQIDYRVKGYRPPQSRLDSDCSAANLCFHNFEWLASSAPSFGFEQPQMLDRLVKVPIHVDDFALFSTSLSYERWEESVIERLDRHEVGVLCLHDCYASFWLPHYPRLLERLQALGRLETVDDLAARVTLSSAV
jgi:hypothetical protein